MLQFKKSKVLDLEAKGCFDFIWNEANTDFNSPGYGMVVDTTLKPGRASIASVGFALSGIVIGIERGWITYEQGYERVLGTLKTLRDNVPHHNGFFVHFIHMDTCERFNNCEYSTIDTALCLNGVVIVSEYFGGAIKEIANELLNRTDWKWLVTSKSGKEILRMSFNQEDSDNAQNNGWSSAMWDHYAEHLMMYFLAAGKEEFDGDLARKLYFDFERKTGSYKSRNFVYCFGGALFIHQFSHAWFDFSKYIDARGMDWFDNSIQATIANRNYCIDNSSKYKTLNKNAWGLTASASPNGYTVYGAAPYGNNDLSYEPPIDGTVMPCGPAGSLPFLPKECVESLEYMYENFPKLWGKYGFYDSYNLELDKEWYSNCYIGIDKGITLLMIDNFQNGTTWKYYMESDFIKKAIQVLGFQERE